MLRHALRRRGGVPRRKSLKRYGRARGNTTHMLPALIRVVVKKLSDALGRGSNRPPARVFNKGERVSKIETYRNINTKQRHDSTPSRIGRAPFRADAAASLLGARNRRAAVIHFTRENGLRRNIRATHTSVYPNRRDAAFTISRSGAFNVSRSAFRHSRIVRYWCLNTSKSGNS